MRMVEVAGSAAHRACVDYNARARACRMMVGSCCSTVTSGSSASLLVGVWSRGGYDAKRDPDSDRSRPRFGMIKQRAGTPKVGAKQPIGRKQWHLSRALSSYMAALRLFPKGRSRRLSRRARIARSYKMHTHVSMLANKPRARSTQKQNVRVRRFFGRFFLAFGCLLSFTSSL